jgi:PAS domain-containing protein
MLMRAVAIRGDDGAIARWYATASDIDELKRMHEALGEREQRLQMALRAGGLGVWDWDPQARLLTLSDAAAEIVGQAPGVHGADALLPLIHPTTSIRRAARNC